MRDLGQRYVAYFNRRYGRTGTLWEGRFRSCLVDSARYVLACHRYIERNPVRAGLVATAAEYPWSSYAANCGTASDPSLTAHPEYLALATDESGRRHAYRELCREPEEAGFLDAVRDATNAGYAVLIGEALKVRLSASSTRPLQRGKPGPRVNADAQPCPETAQLDLS